MTGSDVKFAHTVGEPVVWERSPVTEEGIVIEPVDWDALRVKFRRYEGAIDPQAFQRWLSEHQPTERKPLELPADLYDNLAKYLPLP